MIPWRYHLVSIMAIFLALGLGVVVGTTVINPGLVKNLNDQTDGLKEDLRQLQQEQQDLQAQLDMMNTFSDQAMPYLVADELFGRQVVVVTQEGVDPRALAETRRALDLSGAEIVTTLTVRPTMAADTPASSSDLATLLGAVADHAAGRADDGSRPDARGSPGEGSRRRPVGRAGRAGGAALAGVPDVVGTEHLGRDAERRRWARPGGRDDRRRGRG